MSDSNSASFQKLENEWKNLPALVNDIAFSSKKTMRIILLIFLFCLITVFSSVSYAIFVAKDLKVARVELEKSRGQLALAERQLMQYKASLDPSSKPPDLIDAIIRTIALSRENISNAAFNIQSASNNIKVLSPNRPIYSKWYVVIASYPANKGGLKLAEIFANRLSPFEDCIGIWKTPSGRHFAVVVGNSRSELEARSEARKIQESGLIPDVYAQYEEPEKPWKRISVVGSCLK